jgi:hypothetical protein
LLQSRDDLVKLGLQRKRRNNLPRFHNVVTCAGHSSTQWMTQLTS